MARGNTRVDSDEDERQAEHIEDRYLDRGALEDDAERAWDAVNKAPLPRRAPPHPPAHPRRVHSRRA